MPLVRVEVRNEYGLGSSELYREAVEEEEPKAVLQGVSVAGLVGILRQLGDLAQFSSEVFHDLQEQVIATAARSQRIINRVQRIEAALPPVEKAVLAQTNHIHFAYSAGTDWHTNIQATHSHLINSDLPHFILESYEECRNPPRLQLLDKFDIAGPGACLKRYSDPSFFKNALSPSEPEYTEKARRAKKANRRRRKGSWHMNGEISQALLLSKRSDRKQFASPSYGRSSTADTISTFDMSKSDLGGSTSSSDSRSRSGYRDSVSDVNVSVRREEREDTSLLTSRLKIHSGVIPDSKLPNKQTGVLENDLPNRSSQDKTVPSSCSITWDEKIEIVKPICQQFENNLEELGAISEFQRANPDRDKPESISDESAYGEDILTSPINIYPDDSSYCDSTVPESLLHVNQSDAVRTGLENCATACTMVSQFEPESEYQAEKEVNPTSSDLEHLERECRTSTTIEMNAQSSNSSDVQLFVFDLSSKKQTSPSSSEAVSSDLVHAESLPTVCIYPEPDNSVEAESCLSTNLPDHTRVNNFGSASPGFNVPSSEASSDDKIINSVCDSQVSPSTKGLVCEESLPAISMCPKPDISVEVESCSSTDKPDVSRVNNFGSARSYSSSPGFNVPSSKASANDKIINSVCESQVSASTKDLVHEESLPAISICPELDTSPEVESCSSTDKPDMSRVNNFGSARSYSSSRGFNVVSSKASSNDKIINSVCESQVSTSTKDLVHEESLPAISMCPEPDISPEVESCSSTDKPDVSRVNNFGSARSYSSSPGFNVPSSKASSNDKIINSVCQSQVSASTKDLVHEESLPAISMCPEPDISPEVESCSSTDKPDVSRVNNFGSARSDSSSPGFNVPSSKASSNDKIITSVCQSQVSTSTKDLVHEESLPAISMCPEPDISPEVESCSSTDKPDVPKVNNSGSARSGSSSPGFNVVSSKASSDDKIINSVCESQVSASTEDLVQESPPTVSGGKPTLFWTNGDLLGLEPAKPINKSPNATEKLNDISSDDLTLVNVPSPGAHRGNNEQSSSALLGLSDRISVNIFRRSYTSAPLSSLASGLMKLQETQFSEPKKLNRKAIQASPLPSPNRQFEHGSPVNSVSSSSPPLEHMTLSFQPIDGFETSRLKLRFPDGSGFHDNRHVMLPSFQLVPGPSNSQLDNDYGSDDDTFSRLSDYLSDDVRSQRSYSNSEQWETNETPRGEDHDMYDGLRRVLSEESISSSGEGGSIAESLSGLPNFDSVIPIPSQEERKSNGRDVDSAIDLNYMQSLQPTTLQQYNPAPFPCNKEATTSPPKSENLQKLNGIEETKKTIASEDDNGEEDLLQQIRTRSINLKRTVPTKPILMPNPTANSKVTAILEKASAILQVVGSDEEGEDSESWSDQ
ncbi:hypothetical protein C5167_007274 [Papaver somniferum]|uniref:protein SCAR3-like n=1 Tax=Papaver somniferum TaxID=3469 RepID=UPI000E6F47FA|nr:protein SCAR3-like [Papaver somniferum]RZC93460.1 hypothetical protein C5167_007274 [Papaver somniferum]